MSSSVPVEYPLKCETFSPSFCYSNVLLLFEQPHLGLKTVLVNLRAVLFYELCVDSLFCLAWQLLLFCLKLVIKMNGLMLLD